MPPLVPLVPLLLRGFSTSAVPAHVLPKPMHAPGHPDAGVWHTAFTHRCELTTEWFAQSQYTIKQSLAALQRSPGALPDGFTVAVPVPIVPSVVPVVPLVPLVPLDPAPPSPVPLPLVVLAEHAPRAIAKPRNPTPRIFTLVSVRPRRAHHAPGAAA
ncbi:MAG: hypothetical protein JWP87_271 [Labilithrix sp.]|nr:hypothetical protein [Labilithrix sp.]